jgi:hypothetical protein
MEESLRYYLGAGRKIWFPFRKKDWVLIWCMGWCTRHRPDVKSRDYRGVSRAHGRPVPNFSYMLLLFFSVGAVESPSFKRTTLPTGSLFSASPTLAQQPRARKKKLLVSPVMMENDEITPVAAAAANKKQKAAEDKARRDAHLLRLWCPTSEPTSERDAKAQSTPKQHNIMKRMSSTSSFSSTVRNILPDSNEKDIVPRSSTSSVDSNQESFCYDTLTLS